MATDALAALHTDVTEVGGVAERARVRELILSHYLPADPEAVPEEENVAIRHDISRRPLTE